MADTRAREGMMQSNDSALVRSARRRVRLGLGFLTLGWLMALTAGSRAQGVLVANAGPDRTMLLGEVVALDGSASTGPITKYTWAFTSRPAGSRASISGPNSVVASFVADRQGTYVVRLTVRAGTAVATDTASFTTQNRAPLANAGSDASQVVSKKVTLDGRLSSDPDGDKLTYSWTVKNAPAHSRRVLANPTASRPALLLDRPGTYVVELVVADGRTVSAPDEVVVTTSNTKPVAAAGRDQSIAPGLPVTLDGSGSYDVDEQPLTYAWTLKRPTRSAAVLSDPQSVRPTLVPDVAGNYVATLVVSDGTLTHSDAATVTTANVKPVARVDSGGQGLEAGATVQLDGAGSFDANGSLLTHAWTLTRPAGSAATISDPAAPRPTLTADVGGRYTASLIVRDGAASSAKVNTVFLTGNKAPVADAGPDQSIPVGSVVRLDGAASSDQDGNEFGPGWAFVSRPAGSTAALSAVGDAGSLAALSAAGELRPTFVADQPGTYVLQLIAFDGVALSPADTVVITTTDNVPPVADAGLDQVVTPGTPVTLDGSLSGDADGDALTYAWALVARPAASAALLSSAATAAPAFTPDQPGDYVVQLIVSDGAAASRPDTVVVTTGNARPVARAGADGSGPSGSPVTLDGTASSDANGDTLTYAWALVSRPPGSAAALEDPAADTTRFTPDRPGVYVAQLVVRDAVSRSLPDLVAFTVTATTSHRPVARATGPTSVTAGSTVQLDGSTSSDEDGDPLTFAWTFVSLPAGSAAALQAANTEAPTFRADLPGLYVIELVVNDGTEDSLPARVSVNGNAPPVARAGPDQLIAPPVDVQLDGSESFDPEGCGYPAGDPREKDCLSYEWFVNVWPGHPDPTFEPTLLNPTTVRPSFHAAVDGLYVLQLRVGDDRGALSDTDIVRIKTSNAPPLADAGPDQVDVALEAVVGLSGTASDADGDEVSYSWAFVERPLGSNAVLVDPTSLTPTFVVDVAGRYIVRFEVSDSYLTAVDTVEIRTPNRGPTANAGPDRLGTINVPISVNGSGSDPDGDPITYTWVLVSTPPGSSVVLAGADTSSPSFTPDLGGQYTLRLVVNDGFLDSAADEMVVNATSGNLQLELSPPGLLGVGRTRVLHIALTAPAPAGGVLVSLSSDDPGVASVSPSFVTVPAGGTAASATVEAVAPGDTVLRASALGYVAATTGVSVTAELITLGAGVSAPVGAVSPLPVSIGPAPAPADGVEVTIETSDPLVLEVLTSTVTIAAGEFSANASVRGVAGGSATVIATSPAQTHATATTTVTSTGELRILETAVSLSPGIPRSIRVQLQSGGSPIIAPAPGLVVSLAAADPACVTAPATVTIPAGQTLVRQSLVHGGATPLPCSTTLSATATGLTPGSTTVTVNPTPAITILSSPAFPRLLGAGLQDAGYSARLGTPEHEDVLVRIVSSDPTKLLVSPNATTPGSAQIQVTVPEGQTDVAFHVQGLEEQAGDVTLQVSAPGFTDETSGVISVIPPGVSFLSTVPAATTSLSDDTPFHVYIGPAQLDESDLVPGIVQAIRAGGLPRTVTVTSSQPSVARLRTLGGSTATVAVTIPVGSWQTGFSVATGGVALDPVSAGAATVSATIPDFVTTEGASRTVTVTGPGMTIFTPAYPYGGVFPRYVGAGLQEGSYWVVLGASSHGGVRVRIESNSPATLLVSPDATTPGTPHIEVAVADGQTLASFYVQGLESQAGDVTVTATAPGFTAETSGIISVVPPGVSLSRSLPTATTRLSQDSPFRVFLGAALPDGSDLYLQQYGGGLAYEQAIRAGGLVRQLTLTNSNGPVADLETQAGSGDSVQLTMPEGASSTPHSVDAGGVAFDPISGGTTTVSASIPGFVTTAAASQDVTVSGAGMAVFSPYPYPALQDFPRRLGAGLQEGPYWVRLEASEHGGVSVRIASNDAGRLLVSPDATTPGQPFVDLPVADGQTDVSFYLQGLESQSGDAALNVSAPGFTPATSGVVSVVAPGVSLLGSLPATTTALSADTPFTVSIGPALADGSDLHAQSFSGYWQAIRAGGVARTVTVTSATASVGLVKTQAGSAASVVATIPVGAAYTTSVEAGGVAFDPVSGGTTTVSASIPGFVSTAGASQAVSVTAAGMAIYSPYFYPVLQDFPRYVGAGLQEGPYWVALGGPNHGGVMVRIASGNPAVLLVSPDAATPGTPFIDMPVADGQVSVPFHVQGREGQTGATSVTAAAPGFTGTVSGVINVVTPAVSLLGSLPVETTTASPNTPFHVYLGVPSDDSTSLRSQSYSGSWQAVRAGGPAQTVTVTSSTPSVGRVRSGGVSGASATVTIQPGAPYSDPGALEFVPFGPGTTTVSATIPGFAPVDNATSEVTVVPASISVYSPYYFPALQSFPRYVGAGLQDGPYWLRLGGSAHGGTTVRVESSDPARALVSPDAATPGTPYFNFVLPDGQTDVSFFVQGVENASGDVAVAVSAPGFEDGVSGTITIAAPAYRLVGLPASVTATDETFVFVVELGVPTAGNTDLILQDYTGYGQALRPRPLPAPASLAVSVTNDNAVASQLVTASGGAQSWAISILAGQSTSSTSVSTGGIAFDALSGACTDVGCDTFVEATIPGWIKTQQATRLVRVTP